MNCSQVVNLMSAYVDGELTGEQMLTIRRHMATCCECVEEHESTLRTKRAIGSLVTMRPRRDFVADILTQLDEVAVPKPQRLADWLIRVLHEKVSPVAAALAVSGAALVIMTAGKVDTLTPVATAEATSPPMHQVSFMRNVSAEPGIFATARPLKLATDIPGVGDSQVQLANLTTQ
jgi:anti-sigma factor RsiW